MKQYCGNCGKTGHNYKNCLAPIISLGVILVNRMDPTKLRYLMIQRRDTLGFVEFMRGKYSIDNVEYVKQLFSIMTKKERQHIVTMDFDELWGNLWMDKNNKQYFNEYDNSKNKFYSLKTGFRYNDSFIDLNELNRIVQKIYLSPEWGFPKGRRNLYESDLNCAIREFEEETGIERCKYNLCSLPCVSETFFGTNNIRYKHIYYIAELCDSDVKLVIDPENSQQITEISNIDWFYYTEASNIIRPYNIEKRDVLHRVNSIMLNIT
jgi:8-oxo-dGTP pyrophosphatase MutT (NUDIX family)